MTRFPMTALAIALGSAACGCSSKLLRENVFANTETMLGINVTQNAKTQMYEARIGYTRHELFVVPTSKRVCYAKDGEANNQDDNDPSGTPEVLAEIQVGGEGKQVAGQAPSPGATVKVYQRLAVGKLAVQSNAAIALMAHDDKAAKALAVGPVSANDKQAIADLQAFEDQNKNARFKVGGRTLGLFEAADKIAQDLGFQNEDDLRFNKPERAGELMDKLKAAKLD